MGLVSEHTSHREEEEYSNLFTLSEFEFEFKNCFRRKATAYLLISEQIFVRFAVSRGAVLTFDAFTGVLKNKFFDLLSCMSDNFSTDQPLTVRIFLLT